MYSAFCATLVKVAARRLCACTRNKEIYYDEIHDGQENEPRNVDDLLHIKALIT
jgi:hypothetical protein